MNEFEFVPKIYRPFLEGKKAIERTSIIDAGADWATQEEKPFWLITGGVGCGKTLGAILTASTLAKNGIKNQYGITVYPDNFRYLKIRDLFQFFQSDPSYLNCSGVKTCWLLILDELGTEYYKDPAYWHSILDSLFDARYENLLRTVLISNYSFEKLKTIYPERLIDRLSGLSILTESKEKSMRGNIK